MDRTIDKNYVDDDFKEFIIQIEDKKISSKESSHKFVFNTIKNLKNGEYSLFISIDVDIVASIITEYGYGADADGNRGVDTDFLGDVTIEINEIKGLILDDYENETEIDLTDVDDIRYIVIDLVIDAVESGRISLD